MALISLPLYSIWLCSKWIIFFSIVYEEQLETKISRETENVFTLSPYYDVDDIGATPPPFL